MNREYVRALGADEVIDYQTRDFWTEVHDGDVVPDTVGRCNLCLRLLTTQTPIH